METHAEDRTQRTLGERLLADARVGYNLITFGCFSDACINHAEQQTSKQDGMADIYSSCHDLYNSSVRFAEVKPRLDHQKYKWMYLEMNRALTTQPCV